MTKADIIAKVAEEIKFPKQPQQRHWLWLQAPLHRQ
jgi:hypothetical protein